MSSEDHYCLIKTVSCDIKEVAVGTDSDTTIKEGERTVLPSTQSIQSINQQTSKDRHESNKSRGSRKSSIHTPDVSPGDINARGKSPTFRWKISSPPPRRNSSISCHYSSDGSYMIANPVEKSRLCPTSPLVRPSGMRPRIARTSSVAVPDRCLSPLLTPSMCRDDSRVSYSSQRDENDDMLVPEMDIKERLRLQKMFRQLQRHVHSPEHQMNPSNVWPNEGLIEQWRREYSTSSRRTSTNNIRSCSRTGSQVLYSPGHDSFVLISHRTEDGGHQHRTTDDGGGGHRVQQVVTTSAGSRRASYAISLHGGHSVSNSSGHVKLGAIGKSMSLNPNTEENNHCDQTNRHGSLDTSGLPNFEAEITLEMLAKRPTTLPLQFPAGSVDDYPKDEQIRKRASLIVSSGALTFLLLAASLVTLSFLMSPVIERVFVREKLNNTAADYNSTEFDIGNYSTINNLSHYPQYPRSDQRYLVSDSFSPAFPLDPDRTN